MNGGRVQELEAQLAEQRKIALDAQAQVDDLKKLIHYNQLAIKTIDF